MALGRPPANVHRPAGQTQMGSTGRRSAPGVKFGRGSPPFCNAQSALFGCLVLSVAVAGLLAGCGTTRAEINGRPELKSYLTRIVIEQQGYERARAHTVKALKHASATSPDRSWRTAADRLRSAEREYDALVGRMGAIRAPTGLKGEHAGMVESLRLYRRLVANIERPLRERDVRGMGRTLPLTAKLAIQANDLRKRWRIAAQAAARRLNVPFPVMLEHIGRQMKGPATTQVAPS
jgi:hypothetical protein